MGPWLQVYDRVRVVYRMKKHLSIRLAVILFGMTACVVLLGWIFNTVFLEKYYINEKAEGMISTYEMINGNFLDRKENNNLNVPEIISKCERESISLLVINSSLEIILSSGYSVNGDNLLQRLKDLIFNNSMHIDEMIKEKDNYYLYMIYDNVSKSDYLEIYGTLDTGEILVMRSSINGIKESVSVFNRFYIYVGISLLIICVMFIIFVARNVAKPIKNLANISERMSRLDFTARYEGNENDEIGSLGKSMNAVSNKLERTISELKNANIELQKDLKEKTEIDEMRKEFISNVSHELKTPIALISGYAEGLKECVNDDVESMNFYCDVITDEASKMNKMVMKLLTLNQIEFGNMKLDMERFNIVELFEQILANFKVMFQEKDIKIVFDNTKKCFVWSDEFQISEIITNYISNAINHIGGEKIIFIKLLEENDRVKILVRNTGENIPENELENIWIKFYKVDKARTREYGGSGIGLSIVKAICNSIGQECGVKNTSDGVEFFFTVDGSNH